MSALAFPLTLAQGFDVLCPATGEIELVEPVEESRTAGGAILRSSLGEPLWRGRLTMTLRGHRQAMAAEAVAALLRRPGATFLATDPRYRGPRLDPGGGALGAATPSLHTLDADNRRIRVQGLPAGYVLSPGDLIGWTYGSPARAALHRLVTGATADGSGITPLFEVAPRIRGGAASASVELVRPVCRAVLDEWVPGIGGPRQTSGGELRWVERIK